MYEVIDVRLSVGATRPSLWEEGWVNLIQKQADSFLEIQALIKRCAGMTLTFEMPPKHESFIDFTGQSPVARDPSWIENIHRYNKILEIILGKLDSFGFKVLESRPHFRHTYGQHHLVGTLNMSAGKEAVVGKDFRVIGTDNVYVAGTALIPRLGAPNPTLTAVALSMMLGEQLALRN
jgi:choline dehydrogenase-like flavoprotein